MQSLPSRTGLHNLQKSLQRTGWLKIYFYHPKEGVCTAITTSRSVYVDHSGRLSTDLNDIWHQTLIFA